MKYHPLLLAVLTTFALPAALPAQQPPPPDRLLIGPEEYVRAPRPFPVNLAAATTRFDSIRAGNLAPRDWGMANARPCRPVALVDTTGWKLDDGLALPAEFAPDPSFRSYHGGLKWVAADLELIIENGWWGAAYDSAGYLTSCRVHARSGEYIVSEARTALGFEFRASPYDPSWRPSGAIVGRAPTEDGLRILWTSFMTTLPPRCRYMTGGPVRDPAAPAC
jgi:hypothetical protein